MTQSVSISLLAFVTCFLGSAPNAAHFPRPEGGSDAIAAGEGDQEPELTRNSPSQLIPRDPLRGTVAPEVSGSGQAPAGGTRTDYERAARLAGRFRGKVFGDRIEPNWFADGTRFWYRVTTGPDAHRFILVDAEQGQRREAFDHARLAEALRDAGLRDVRPQSLPLEQLAFHSGENTVEFQAGGRRWRCDLESYALAPVGSVEEATLPAMAPQDAPQASTRTGAETHLTFVNGSEQTVELFWLDSGGRRRSYGTLAPGGERRQPTYAGHLWLVADEAGGAIAVFEAAERGAKVLIGAEPAPRSEEVPRRRPRREQPRRETSPDGRWEAFFRDHNLWLRDAADGAEHPLTRDGASSDAYVPPIHWSPDSRKLAAVRRQPAQERLVHLVESSPRDRVEPRLHSFSYLKPGDRVAVDKPQLFDLETKSQVHVDDALFENPYDVRSLRWHDDSSRFTFVYNQRGHQVLRVVAVDAETGYASAVIDETSETFVCYSSKFFCRHLDATDEIIWMSERDGWNHLYLYDARTGGVKNQITRGPWVVRGVERVDADARQIVFRAGGIHPEQDPYYVHYARVNFDGSGLTVLTESNGTHSVQFSPDRRFFVATWSRVDHPPVHELCRSEDGALLCTLETADISELHKAGWQAPEPFVAKGRDGKTDIYGVILRPTTFDPARSYPILENIYAGPQGSFVPKGFQPFYRMMELAELGFIVVQIDGMGTSNRSKAFHDVCWRNLADSGLPDRVLWITASAETRPYMDLERVGIYGGSAGGQSAAAAVMTHGHFYKAAAADCGCHDNRMDKLWWNEQWMGWPIGPHYDANSIVTLAPRLEGKLLLTVGELDRNVDPASTMQVVDALIRADKDFELLVIPGAGHGAGETPYAARRRADFFVRHLLGVEPRGE